MAVAMAAILGKTRPKLACEALRRFRGRRDMGNRLRRFNRGLLVSDDELRSIARCGNALGNLVMLRQSKDGRIRPSGVATCKSVWGSLGCAARRRAKKSAMVKWYVDRHLEAGQAVPFGSFTLAHYTTDDLAKLLTGLRDAFTDMRDLKVYRDAVDRYGIDGWTGALEITDGDNCWHPHLHVLFFHRDFLGVEYGENADLKAALHEAFSRQIDRHLGRQVHQIHGGPGKTLSGWGDSNSRPLDPQENSRRPSPSHSVQIGLFRTKISPSWSSQSGPVQPITALLHTFCIHDFHT